MTRDLKQIMRSGYVTRWHANADMAHIRETVAEHHARVAQIIFALHPNPRIELIDAALHHDCGEMVAGDVPSPVKELSPEISALLDDLEHKARADMRIPRATLTGLERRWLHFADKLAAYLHVRKWDAIMLNTLPYWKGHVEWLMEESDALGVALGDWS